MALKAIPFNQTFFLSLLEKLNNVFENILDFNYQREDGFVSFLFSEFGFKSYCDRVQRFEPALREGATSSSNASKSQ